MGDLIKKRRSIGGNVMPESKMNKEERYSLYQKIGGQETVEEAVQKLSMRMLTDPLLSPFFSYEKMEMIQMHQRAFLTMAFGGPFPYRGRTLREAHAPLLQNGLGDEHFDAVKNHLAAVMQELYVSENDILQIIGIIERTRKYVLGQK